MQLLEGNTDVVLFAFFIDQVHQLLRTVQLFGFGKVQTGSQQVVVVVAVHYHGWLPLQVGLHAPLKRDGATNLHV